MRTGRDLVRAADHRDLVLVLDQTRLVHGGPQALHVDLQARTQAVQIQAVEVAGQLLGAQDVQGAADAREAGRQVPGQQVPVAVDGELDVVDVGAGQDGVGRGRRGRAQPQHRRGRRGPRDPQRQLVGADVVGRCCEAGEVEAGQVVEARFLSLVFLWV